MTEPQELRSIDELFKNTFENLPDSPADSGWDTPSERVWDHVRHNIQAPRSGWSLQSLMVLAGFAVVLAVGLYFAFSGNNVDVPVPVENRTEAEVATNVAELPEAPAPLLENAAETAAADLSIAKKASAPRSRKAARNHTDMKSPAPEMPDDKSHDLLRRTGAAPLPGSSDVKIPNTTEALKIERAKQLEQLWKTPLEFLPVPNTKKAN